MSRPRLFDHDEAARRAAAGESYYTLAAEYGVTYNAVEHAVKRLTDPEWAARDRDYHREIQKQARCVDCGKPCTHNAHHQRNNKAEPRCRDCAILKYNTYVRDGEAKCATCKQWKPLDQFTRTVARRLRGVSSECCECQTARRKAYREARKVPCVDCGTKVLPRTPGESGGSLARGLTEPRCRSCANRHSRERATP